MHTGLGLLSLTEAAICCIAAQTSLSSLFYRENRLYLLKLMTVSSSSPSLTDMGLWVQMPLLMCSLLDARIGSQTVTTVAAQSAWASRLDLSMSVTVSS